MKKEMMLIIGMIGILAMMPSACADAIIIEHTCTDLSEIPGEWVEEVKDNLHIAYQRTSHSSQLIDWHEGVSRKFDGIFAELPL